MTPVDEPAALKDPEAGDRPEPNESTPTDPWLSSDDILTEWRWQTFDAEASPGLFYWKYWEEEDLSVSLDYAVRIAEEWHASEVEVLETRIRELEGAFIEIRDELAGSCPAWELEWDKVCSETNFADNEVFTVQEVRDAARRLLDPIAEIVWRVLAGVRDKSGEGAK